MAITATRAAITRFMSRISFQWNLPKEYAITPIFLTTLNGQIASSAQSDGSQQVESSRSNLAAPHRPTPMTQVIGVPKEIFPGEKRVATVPEVVPKLTKLGFSVIVQSGAGESASIDDAAYAAAGARVVPDAASVWSGADIVFKVRAPSRDEIEEMRA